MDYLYYNPVEAGIVLSSEYYLYSSAASFAGLKENLIDVILI
jgi:putative transposase